MDHLFFILGSQFSFLSYIKYQISSIALLFFVLGSLFRVTPTVPLGQDDPSESTENKSAVKPTKQHPHRQQLRNTHDANGLLPLIGIPFTIVFLIGFSELLHSVGLSKVGVAIAALMVVGAMVSEEALVTGDVPGGLFGMLAWGGATWMLATHRLIPWAFAGIIAWCVFQMYRSPHRP